MTAATTSAVVRRRPRRHSAARTRHRPSRGFASGRPRRQVIRVLQGREDLCAPGARGRRLAVGERRLHLEELAPYIPAELFPACFGWPCWIAGPDARRSSSSSHSLCCWEPHNPILGTKGLSPPPAVNVFCSSAILTLGRYWPGQRLIGSCRAAMSNLRRAQGSRRRSPVRDGKLLVSTAGVRARVWQSPRIFSGFAAGPADAHACKVKR